MSGDPNFQPCRGSGRQIKANPGAQPTRIRAELRTKKRPRRQKKAAEIAPGFTETLRRAEPERYEMALVQTSLDRLTLRNFVHLAGSERTKAGTR